MIIKFKLFENVAQDEDELAEQFSQKYVEKYYDDNYEISPEEASNYVNIWAYVDIDKVRRGLIEETADGAYLDDKIYKKTDFAMYILDNLLGVAKPYIEKFKKKYKIEFENNEDVLFKMSKKGLIEILVDTNSDYDFLLNYWEEKWEDEHPEQILTQIWGKHTIRDNVYSYIKDYVNDDDLVEACLRNVEYDTKFEYIKDYIYNDMKLQEKLIKMNPKNVFALFDVMDETISIGNNYDYQKLYLDTKEYEEADEEEIEEELPIKVEQLHKKFGLDPEIRKEYSKYTYLIDANKYNL